MTDPTSPKRSDALLRRLEWTVLRRLDGQLQGNHRTLWRGGGLDLADLREYQHHDDVRHIDWNVTARLQVPHVRQFTEDRELSAWFLVDLSGSVDFGSDLQTKTRVAREFVGVLARLLTRHGNRVGALLYGDKVDAVLPARGGRQQVLQLLQLIDKRDSRRSAAASSRPPSCRRCCNRRSRSSSGAAPCSSSPISSVHPAGTKLLGRLALRHEVTAVRLFDPLEMETARHRPADDARRRNRRRAGGRYLGPRLSQTLCGRRRAARRPNCARPSAAPASTRWSWRPTTTCSTRILRFADLRKQRSRLAAGGGAPIAPAIAGGRAARRPPRAAPPPAARSRCRLAR